MEITMLRRIIKSMAITECFLFLITFIGASCEADSYSGGTHQLTKASIVTAHGQPASEVTNIALGGVKELVVIENVLRNEPLANQ